MENILPIIQPFLQNLNPLWYLVILIVLVVILTITKNYKALKTISEEGIRASAKYFNSDEGQKKLENAVSHLQNKIKDLPWLARIILEKFGTKAVLVSIIEWFYKLIKNKLKLEIAEVEMDIKGNEVKKLDLNVYRDDKLYTLDLTKQTTYTDRNLEFYGKLIAETDFHSDPKLRSEIGFKKRF